MGKDEVLELLRTALDCVDEQAQMIHGPGLVTVAIPQWYLDAKRVLEAVPADDAERALEALELAAKFGETVRLYLPDREQPLDVCSVTCDVLRGRYRYWLADSNQTLRNEDGKPLSRDEALAVLRAKG